MSHEKLAGDYDQLITSDAFRDQVFALPENGGRLELHNKEASANNDRVLRRRIKENSFTEAILPAENIPESQLAYVLETDIPHVIEEMEGEIPGAVTVPFGTSPDTYFFEGNKFVVYFSETQTPEFVANVYRLKNWKGDHRKLTTDNALKDMQTELDFRFIRTVDRIVGAVNGVGYADVEQNVEINGPITRQSYVDVKNPLEDRKLNNGVMLVSRRTANEFLKMGPMEAGDSLSQQMLTDGTRAVQKFQWFGIPHVLTIKNELVADMVTYSFAPPNYLGKHYVLQPVTMYVKREKDLIRFQAVMKSGFTIANVAAVQKTRHVVS